MPKDGFLTPKAIANRIKAKGLQKLRWYCQMCEKQCRDENGFKCHTRSESHLRQMQIFRENSGSYIQRFSQEFEEAFMDVLRRKGETLVKANTIYQEVIADKKHVHMNATSWGTLTAFCKYLSKARKAELHETPKGLYLKYVKYDPELIARMDAAEKKEKHDLDAEERYAKMLQRQIELAREAEDAEANARGDEDAEPEAPKELKREGEGAPLVQLQFKTADSLVNKAKLSAAPLQTAEASASAVQVPVSAAASVVPAAKSEKRKASALDELKEELERKKQSQQQQQQQRSDPTEVQPPAEKRARVRKDYWVVPGIVVKVVNKSLADGKYYKQKGVVEDVQDRYTAQVRMQDSNDVLRLDQSMLETVIPAFHKPVRIVNGEYRGDNAVLLSLDQEKFCVTVRIEGGDSDGKIVERVPLEDVCKLA